MAFFCCRLQTQWPDPAITEVNGTFPIDFRERKSRLQLNVRQVKAAPLEVCCPLCLGSQITFSYCPGK